MIFPHLTYKDNQLNLQMQNGGNFFNNVLVTAKIMVIFV